MDKRLEEIRARAEKATKGPWAAYRSGERNGGRPFMVTSSPTGGRVLAWLFEEADGSEEGVAQFMAAARDDVPWLLAELEKERATSKELLDYIYEAKRELRDETWAGDRLPNAIRRLMARLSCDE